MFEKAWVYGSWMQVVKGQVVAEQDDIPDYDFQAPASVVDRFEVGGKPVS
ncbi:hypothetical protein BOO71_0003406 [Deinococcus marmoris]|uniref:Uncharacterized protein n=2 Tax=Deinococcus marmoris TaxID=249408 RepID=A0A1U7P1Z7_9DEIO|nr:hypothetical protein BOO71_0003406 [Deinococcus marmoris]